MIRLLLFGMLCTEHATAYMKIGKALSEFMPVGHVSRPVARDPSIARSDLSMRSARLKPLAAVLGTLLSASLGTLAPEALASEAATLPSIVLPAATERMPTFQERSVDFAESLVPIVGSLEAKPTAALASKAVALAATGDPKEIIKTIDAGLDAFLSVPPERFYAAAMTLKQGTARAAQAPSCNLVCLPPAEQTAKVARVAGDALSMTDPDKLKTFILQGGMSLGTGDKSQYAGVLAEALKFSLSLNKQDVLKAKDAGIALLMSADNIENPRPAVQMPATPSFPANKNIEQAALELADALYPIVSNLEAKDVAPLAAKLVTAGTTGDPKEIIKTLDAGLDAFLSVPPERTFAAAKALKGATSEATRASQCNLVCVPALATVEKAAGAAANALSVTDPTKLTDFVLQLIRSLASGDKQKIADFLAEAKRWEASLNQADVVKAKAAGLELLRAAGVTDRAVLGLFTG